MQFVGRTSAIDLAPLVSRPDDADLMRKARLDCDWYAENVRCFAALSAPGCEFLPAWTTGLPGLVDLARRPPEAGEERWLVMVGQQPQALADKAAAVFTLLSRMKVRILYYAFDEASRTMPCFRAIAPYLDVLIHDEAPLDLVNTTALRPDCHRLHYSWVANVLPFAVPFNEEPEAKILFLGSQLGLTDHRRRQIDFLRQHFRDRFVASHDHSVSVADRHRLNRYKVGLCPEGRKFTTPAMSRSHTDRPFWSGCLGLVPVSENSVQGDRLDELATAGLIIRYPHADLAALVAACEKALEMPNDKRRSIYQHFNEHETVGTVVAAAIAACGP